MGAKSGIEWTDATWNPVTGCTPISEGCKNCYAKEMAEDFQRRGVEKYRDGFDVRIHPDTLNIPRKWKKGKTIFVNAMADLFHNEVPFDFVYQVYQVMRETPQHTYQVLTKRPARMLEYYKYSGLINEPAIPNVWVGVTGENQQRADERVPVLQQLPVAIRFVSVEPQLGYVDLSKYLTGPDQIHWVISGGETGKKYRMLDLSWVRHLRDQCTASNTAFFYKQVGGRGPDRKNNDLDGRNWREFPTP